ncbi:MAG: hypothetical protein EXR97_03580 [Nitrospiraceae bacterium]|nr:hypothetical protein [Nitrospiraceae bacterium]
MCERMVRTCKGSQMTHRKHTIAVFCGLALMAAVAGAPAQAAEIEGIQFADRVQAGTTALVLTGVGLARYLFFKVYVTALYVSDGIPADKVLTDVPKRLELSYFQSIKAGDFATAADQVLPDNVPDDKKNGAWVYSAFGPDGKPLAEDFNKCRACHAPLVQKDFVHRYDEYFEKRGRM